MTDYEDGIRRQLRANNRRILPIKIQVFGAIYGTFRLAIAALCGERLDYGLRDLWRAPPAAERFVPSIDHWRLLFSVTSERSPATPRQSLACGASLRRRICIRRTAYLVIQ
jgi:hypothetical protein